MMAITEAKTSRSGSRGGGWGGGGGSGIRRLVGGDCDGNNGNRRRRGRCGDGGGCIGLGQSCLELLTVEVWPVKKIQLCGT